MQEEQIEATEANIVTLIKENTDLTSEIHTLTTQVAKNAALIVEEHRHVTALTTRAGLDADDFPPDTSPPATAS